MLREGTAKCLDRLRKEESKKISPIAKTTPWSCCTQVSSRHDDRGEEIPFYLDRSRCLAVWAVAICGVCGCGGAKHNSMQPPVIIVLIESLPTISH